MKHIEIIKETEDLREGRGKKLRVGTKFSCSNELADKYLKKKLAKVVCSDIEPKNPLKSAKDVEDYESSYNDKD